MSSNGHFLQLKPLPEREGLSLTSQMSTSRETTPDAPTEASSMLETYYSSNPWYLGLQKVLSRFGLNSPQTAASVKSDLIPYYPTGRRLPHTRAFRFCILLLAAPLALLTCSTMWGVFSPSFTDISRFERELPQHRWDVRVNPSTGELVEKGCHGKRVSWEERAGEGYLRVHFLQQLSKAGFSSGLEQVLLSAHLAHLSNRSYVFEDSVKSSSPFPYTLDRGLAIRPTRVPLNAVISGFIAGANISSSGVTAPNPIHLSISADYYDHICPSSLSAQHRVVISANDSPSDVSDGASQMQRWVERVKHAGKGKRCVEIIVGGSDAKRSGKRLFTYHHLEPIQDVLFDSPVIKHFSYSNLVEKSIGHVVKAMDSSSPGFLHSIVPDLLVIDLRRDTGLGHCARKPHAKGANRQKPFPQRKPRLSPIEDEREDTDAHLERRWWYWAGRAGQRLSSTDVGANTAAASSSSSSDSTVTKIPSTRARYAGVSAVPHQTSSSGSSAQAEDSDDAGTPKPKEKSGGVRIVKEDFDFSKGRGRGRVQWQTHPQEEVFAVPSEEVSSTTTAPRRTQWMWWGSGSRRTSMSRVAVSGHRAQETSGIDIDEERDTDLEIRSFNDEVVAEKPRPWKTSRCRPPTIDQVVQRAREARDQPSSTPLTKVLILSNFRCPYFVSRLSSALVNDGWEVVDSGRRSIANGLNVDGAVDMALAEKAERFLGNKFSTLSRIVDLRRTGGRRDEETGQTP